MSVSYLPSTRIVVDLARLPAAIEPIACGVRGISPQIESWDSLLRVIMARLRLTVGEHDYWAAKTEEGDKSQRVQTSVLECVSALSQIHGLLMREEDRRCQLENEIREARMALAKVCDELGGAKAAEKQMRFRSLHDDLTLLPNEEYFNARLTRALNPADLPRQSLAVLYIRLEDLKSFNDMYGSSGGGEMIKTVAARLALALRAEDMLCRQSEDVFACLVTGVSNRGQLCDLAYKLLGIVSAPLSIGALQHCMRANIGIAIPPANGVSAEALLLHAEFAMARAQRENTGYAFCDEG